MESTLTNHKGSKKQTMKNHDRSSTESFHKGKDRSDSHADEIKSTKAHQSIKNSSIDDLIPLAVTPVSPSPPPSITDEFPFNPETSSITHEPTKDSTILSSNCNKRSSDNQSIDEGLLPSKRSRLSQDSLDKGTIRSSRLTYQDIAINDLLFIKCNLKQKKEHWGRCLQKNNENKELFIHYQGFDST